MSFLKRVGEGISIAVVSMLFPFKHPALFLYPLICGAIVLPTLRVVRDVVQGLDNVSNDILMFMMAVIVMVVVYIFILGLVRGSIARMEGGTIKFWRAMKLDGRILICLFFFVLISAFLRFFAPGIEYFYLNPMMSVMEFETLAWATFVVSVAWSICVFYFIPTIAYETKNFFDAVGRSIKHFLHSFVEVICAFITSVAMVSAVIGVGAFLAKMDHLSFSAKMFDVTSAPLVSLVAEGAGALFVLAIALILATGLAIIVPGLYFYVTHKLKNPFTSTIRKK